MFSARALAGLEAALERGAAQRPAKRHSAVAARAEGETGRTAGNAQFHFFNLKFLSSLLSLHPQ